VTSSGAPYSAPFPPIPSTTFAIPECAFTENLAKPFSISYITRFPLKSTVAKSLTLTGDALNVVFLIPSGFSQSASISNFP
jgi:hypothetical protein